MSTEDEYAALAGDNTFVSNEDKVDAIFEVAEELNPWEGDFMGTMRKCVDHDWELSQKQQDILDKIYKEKV